MESLEEIPFRFLVHLVRYPVLSILRFNSDKMTKPPICDTLMQSPNM